MTDQQPNLEGATLIPSSNGQLYDSDLQTDENVALTITAVSPLGVIFNTAGKDSLIPGSVFILSVTVSNKGSQSAVIDIWIDPISEEIRQWYTPGRERLALGPGQSNEVVFQFRVPAGTIPGLYFYQVVVDAQEHYPEDTPLRFPQQIQVLTAIEDIVRDSNPTFVLQPVSRSTEPILLQPGEALQLQVMVDNRGDRVDRFRMICPDLPQDWHTIVYPQGVQESGLVVQSNSLNLNPGEQGLILWVIIPPLNTLAGNYVPTLRLYSDNYPELMLLDLVYLQVLPAYALQVELRTLMGRVKQQAGVFQVRLNNTGNTPRLIALQAHPQDEGDSCTYTLAQSIARIVPQETVAVELQVCPSKRWQRPFYGGRVFNFSVGLEDTQQHPIPIDNLQSVLIWEPRPWWHLLLFFLLGLLTLLAIAYLIWRFFFRTAPPLKILDFFSENSRYAAENGDVVRLGWHINQPKQVQSITIAGLSAEGEPLTRPDVYDLSKGLPSALEPFCTQGQGLLVCRNFRTSARKAGTYFFEITLQSNSKQEETALIRKTGPIKIEPIPLPQIASFSSTQPTYREQRPSLDVASGSSIRQGKHPPQTSDIRFNWTVTYPARLQELRLIGRNAEGGVISPLKRYDLSQGLPWELQSACKVAAQLICKNVATGATRPGDYIFELSTVPRVGIGTAISAKKAAPIKVLPRPPQIISFSINGQPAKPSYLIPIVRQKVPKILLSWQVEASQGTKTSLMPFPGNVPLQGSVPITLSPKPSSSSLTLQAISPSGEQVTRSVTLETYDPNPTNPEKVAAAAAKAAATQIAKAQQQAAQEQVKGNKAGTTGNGTGQSLFQLPSVTPTPSRRLTPDTLSPLELPPQLDRH
jgi:hypothetical protein